MILMIGTVKTLHKYQISNITIGQSSLLSRALLDFSEVVGKSGGFRRMFVCIQTEIYSVEMFSLRGLTVKMIWSDKHEIVGETFPALYCRPDFFY